MALAEVVELQVAPSGKMSAEEEQDALLRIHADLEDLAERSPRRRSERHAVEAHADLIAMWLDFDYGIKVGERQ